MTPIKRAHLLRRGGASVALAVAVVVAGCSSSKTTAAPGTTGTGAGSAPPPSSAPSTTPAPGSPPSTTVTCTTRPTTAGGQGGGDVLVPGDIPDSQKYKEFSAPSGYRISFPDSWGRSSSGNGFTFSDKFSSIRIEVTAAPTAPTVASAQSTEVPALASSVRCFEPGKVRSVTRPAGPAVLITYRADSDADAVTGKVVRQDVERYEFWRGGRQATITLSSPKGSDNVDPWKKVTDSFSWGP